VKRVYPREKPCSRSLAAHLTTRLYGEVDKNGREGVGLSYARRYSERGQVFIVDPKSH